NAGAEPPGLWARLGRSIGSGYPREPWEWTGHYSNLANFLRTALQTGPLAFPVAQTSLPPITRAPTPPAEWPMYAAIRINDRIFTGSSHFDAVTKAQTALGENVVARSNVSADGFLTNQGRYVSREEAGRMLDQLNETRHYRTWFGNDKKGKAGLLS